MDDFDDESDLWAALTIQARFRGFVERQLFRKTLNAVVQLQASIRGYIGRKTAPPAQAPARKKKKRRPHWKTLARRGSLTILSESLQWAPETEDTATFTRPKSESQKLVSVSSFDDVADYSEFSSFAAVQQLFCTVSPLSSICVGAAVAVVLSCTVALLSLAA
jgi:hypothetical protein